MSSVLYACLFIQGYPGRDGRHGPPGPIGSPGPKVYLYLNTTKKWQKMMVLSKKHNHKTEFLFFREKLVILETQGRREKRDLR